MGKKIVIKGAKEHNLKNISVEIPKDNFIVITGLSGSGKSSLAFDTIYAEGQRRYVESLSAYARQFLDKMKKPKVDLIEGLSPAISIVFEFLITFIAVSIFSTATEMPNNKCAFSWALFKSNFIFLVKVFSLKFTNSDINSLKFNIFGFPSTIAKVLKPKEVSTEVNLYNCLFTVSASTCLLKSITTLTPSRLDSSLISLIPSIFLSLANSAILSFKTDLFTW